MSWFFCLIVVSVQSQTTIFEDDWITLPYYGGDWNVLGSSASYGYDNGDLHTAQGTEIFRVIPTSEFHSISIEIGTSIFIT